MQGAVNDGLVFVCRGGSKTFEDLHTIDMQEPGQDRAQLRNEFLSFDTENTGTITHLQAVLLDLTPQARVSRQSSAICITARVQIRNLGVSSGR